MAVWRRSQRARSFEGSGHLGPHDRVHARLESGSLGSPATRCASEFTAVRTSENTPYRFLFTVHMQHVLGEPILELICVVGIIYTDSAKYT